MMNEWISRLSKFLSAKSETSEDGSDAAYKVYTRKFDRVIAAKDIDLIIGYGDRKALGKQREIFDSHFSELTLNANLFAAKRLGRFQAEHSEELAEIAGVSILVDHSGSLKGQRAILAKATVDILADCLSRLGLKYEVLGFTTSSWRGGESRKKWFREGRQRHPGRLCDLLHIVYREFEDTIPGTDWAL